MNKLPSNWQVKSLGDLFHIYPGGTPSRNIMEYWNGDVPWVKISDMLRNNITDTEEKISAKGLENSSAKIIPKGSLLISIFATVGRTAFLEIDAATNQAIVGLVAKKNNLDKKFVRYYLDSKVEALKNISRGVAQSNINKSILSNIKILLPPLPIQKQIAAILEKADQAKQKRKEANKLTDEFLQSVFIEMFGDPVKNPKGWEVYLFDKLVEKFQYGTSVKSSQKGVPVLRIPNIIQGVLDLRDLKMVQLSVKEQESIILNHGDILFVRTNGNPNFVGRCALFNLIDKYVFASYLIRAVIKKENANSIFLVYLLGNLNYRNIIRSKCSTTAGQFNINTKGLGSLPIILPPLSLQQQFVEIVNKTEALKEKQKQSELKLENLFQSLIQKAFKRELV